MDSTNLKLYSNDKRPISTTSDEKAGMSTFIKSIVITLSYNTKTLHLLLKY